jgi:hypothetical protein
MEKKKRIISLENLEPKIKDALMKKYPSGFDPFIQKIQGIKGEELTVVTLETDDSIFMVKVKANLKKAAREDDDDDDDDEAADDIPETSESFGDDDEFGKDEEDDSGFKDEPVEEYDDDDDDDADDDGGADED